MLKTYRHKVSYVNIFLCQVAISNIVSWMSMKLGNPLASIEKREETKTISI